MALKKEISSIQSTNTSLELALIERDEKIKRLQADLTESEDARRRLKLEVDEMTRKMIVMEEQLFESKSLQLELLDNIKLLENNLKYAEEKLRELISVNEQLERGQAIYIAKKNDRIDNLLAKELNNYPERDKLKIMFLRESEGVYQFGQKRVYIKIERGNTLMVRVGGGYLGIDNFI